MWLVTQHLFFSLRRSQFSAFNIVTQKNSSNVWLQTAGDEQSQRMFSSQSHASIIFGTEYVKDFPIEFWQTDVSTLKQTS